ncbi:hypothetical protein G3M48_002125 [Beauveria asiatica]|uniref:Uncharacterized protein n=1 Tax=Beauveria asiatica TaxID=1069075 RepID=A0AAW0S6Z2_9HYPO
MPPPLQKANARKKAVTLRYGTKTAQQPTSTERDANAEALALSRRAQALELTNASLLRANDKLTLGNDKLTLSNEKLTRDNRELTRSNKKLTRSNKDLTRSSSLIAAESAERRTRIAQLLDELATLRRTYTAEHARLLKRAGVIAGDLGRTLRDKRALRTQLAYDSLESKIHRSAVQVAHRVFKDRHDKDVLLRILKSCRRAYTGSDGPPAPRPPSPAPDTAAAADAAAATATADLVGELDKVDSFVVAEQQGMCTPMRPSRVTLITPVSISPRPVSLTDSHDFVLHTPTRREGLRPRKPYVYYPNDSLW